MERSIGCAAALVEQSIIPASADPSECAPLQVVPKIKKAKAFQPSAPP